MTQFFYFLRFDFKLNLCCSKIVYRIDKMIKSYVVIKTDENHTFLYCQSTDTQLTVNICL